MTINVVKKIFYVICLAAVIAMLFFGYQAYDKKNNYKNSEYSLLTENAYVGGDAYNYIINAGYFAGYLSLCGSCLITATISFGCGVLAEIAEKKNDAIGEKYAGCSEALEAKENIVTNT